MAGARSVVKLVVFFALVSVVVSDHAGDARARIPWLASMPASRQRRHDEPHRIELKGGLLHQSGYYAPATVGGQKMRLQVDFSQGAITVPVAGCTTCRIGDNRYDPQQSTTSLAVLCNDARCGQTACDHAKCASCSSSGAACCGPGVPPTCAYNVAFVDGSNANGTMYEDALELGGLIVPSALFAAMYEESRLFEMPYVDGVLGMGYGQQACYPTCPPAAMDTISAASGLPNIFTMCVNRHGGSLVIGASADSLTEEPFKYVDLANTTHGGYFHVRAQGFATVGSQRVELPEIANAIWSSATTSIVIGTTTFMAILEQIMMYTCEVPGLCSPHSWFRPSSCHPLSDADLAKMPRLSFYLAGDTEMVLEPEDYLLLYKDDKEKPMRCVAFKVTNILSARGVGIMFGSTVMSRYAVTFDREKHRVGIAKAKRSECGPATGSDHGLQATSGSVGNPSDMPILTADSAPSNLTALLLPSDMEQAERCRALSSCDGCAAATNCSYRYTDGRCLHVLSSGRAPYPYCQGQWCMCFAVNKTGWYLGIAIGASLALVMFSCCVCAYKLRRQKIRYQEVVPYAENEVETF